MSAVSLTPRRRLFGIRRADYVALVEAFEAQVAVAARAEAARAEAVAARAEAEQACAAAEAAQAAAETRRDAAEAARTVAETARAGAEAACNAAEAARAAAEERDRARAARYETTLADAQALAARIGEATVTLAQLVRSDRVDREQLAGALQRLLAPGVAAVELTRRRDLPRELRDPLAERDGSVVTLGHAEPGAAGEHALNRTLARAGELVVVAQWAEGRYDDGPLRTIVEQLCRAAAASVASRDLVRPGRRRRPLSLLGGATDATRFSALRAAQDAPSTRVLVQLRSGAMEAFTGLFGEPAWEGELFHLAQALDSVARTKGGEAFELEDAFACVVPDEHASDVRAVARLLLEASRVEATVVP
jgi:hypothetical protein